MRDIENGATLIYLRYRYNGYFRVSQLGGEYFKDHREIEGVELIKGVKARPIHLDEDLMVVIMVVEEDVPNHSHENTQYGVILQGEGFFTIGGRETKVREGVFYHIPSNVEHSLKVTKTPLIAMDIFKPPREDYKKLFE
jgi:quercetin dioxygenase-like cupin family protein